MRSRTLFISILALIVSTYSLAAGTAIENEFLKLTADDGAVTLTSKTIDKKVQSTVTFPEKVKSVAAKTCTDPIWGEGFICV